MSDDIEWIIPASVLRWLDEAPRDRPVVILLRHSVRPPLDPGDAGYMLPLTSDGVRLATDLGRRLGARLRTLHASPLLRCVQTAEALRGGAGVDLTITPDRLLGDPGVFVHDNRLAWPNWQSMGHEGVMSRLVSDDSALTGMASPTPAARFLVHHMLARAGDRAGVHVFVTHDSLVTAAAARLLGEALGRDAWPMYLEGAFFWREGDALHTAYRDTHRACLTGPLCGLNERDVIELARREVGAVLGHACEARFFVAGGVFKTLLTGRAPRDLDLWAASTEDHETLIESLTKRGARPLEARPFADAFEIADRIVEVPHHAAPGTLEERLARFDLALSAVGVEHQTADRWRSVIHPLALESVARREVLLLKPLVNWRHALSTLARLRRYAEELRFSVPPEEEAEVWRVFDEQPREMQLGMLARFELASVGGYGVREEAECRLR